MQFQQSVEKQKDDEVQNEIKKDLSSMSERERLEIFHRENPEFTSLVDEFKGKRILTFSLAQQFSWYSVQEI